MSLVNNVLSSLKSYVGYTEGKNNDNIFGKEFGKNFVAWCAEMLSVALDKAGLRKNIDYPYTASSGEGVSWFKKNNRFHSTTNYTPQAGDFIYFATNDKPYHVGIVDYVQNGLVYTIEGNSGDKVATRKYALTDNKIYGYGSPNYSSATSGGNTGMVFGFDENGKVTFNSGNLNNKIDQAASLFGKEYAANPNTSNLVLILVVISGLILAFMGVTFLFSGSPVEIIANSIKGSN